MVCLGEKRVCDIKYAHTDIHTPESNQDVNIYVRKANRIGEPRKLNTNTRECETKYETWVERGHGDQTGIE